MDRLKNIPFTSKLFFAVILICVLAVSITAAVTYKMSRQGLLKLGETALINSHQGMYDTLSRYDQGIRQELAHKLILLTKEIENQGGVEITRSTTIKQTMTNEGSGVTSTEEIPRLMVGPTYINGNTSFIDQAGEKLEAVTSLLQLIDDKLLRIASTKDQNGNRRIDSYIDSSSDIYQKITTGQSHNGRERINGQWHLTTYTPLLDYDDKISGAIYVAKPMLNDEVVSYINATKSGNGYYFVYGEDGSMLIHPTLRPGTNLFDMIPEFREVRDGTLQYNWKGSTKFTITKLSPSWGVHIAVGMSETEIMAGLDKKIIGAALVTGGLVIVMASVFTLLLIRSINNPLRELANKSILVGEGDYSVSFSAKTNDSIGQLTNALGTMVTRTREVIHNISSSAMTLQKTSKNLDLVSSTMVENAKETTALADDFAISAKQASENTASISAAMEQGSANLDMVASASEQMRSTIQEIAQNNENARRTTEQAVENVTRSAQGIQKLGDAAKNIGSITETIADISAQTNLLALNATIEAARAGDAGKGFAVVANEIKDLANETANATSKITTAIHEIQTQTGETVTDIQAISQVIRDVNDIVRKIIVTVDEQAVSTKDIAENTQHVSKGINEITANVSETNTTTTFIAEGAEDVKRRSIAIHDNSTQLQNSALELSEIAKDLSAIIARFSL